MGIKERFGTDWIGTGSGSPAQSRGINDPSTGSGDSYDYSGSRGLKEANPAFVTLGKQIARFLQSTDGVDKLYNLADKMHLEPADLAPVTEWMAKSYYIRVEPDTYGNHELRLTGRAKELIEA